MRIKFVLLFSLLVTLAGCSGPEAWSDALEETAPPNPNRTYIEPTQEATTEQESAPVEEQQEEAAEATTPAPVPVETEARPTRISATLLGYPSCHVGAVRFYVNRRYRAAFDDEGNVAVEVSPGELTLEVWDSGGHWIKKVNISEGQTLNVTFGCDEKTTNVQGIERQNEEG